MIIRIIIQGAITPKWIYASDHVPDKGDYIYLTSDEGTKEFIVKNRTWFIQSTVLTSVEAVELIVSKMK